MSNAKTFIIDSNDVCSVTLSNIVKIWSNASINDVIVVKTSWKASVKELERWCQETNNVMENVSTENGKYVIRIRLTTPFG
ncbi:hypothetical protein HS7_19980 [Sulfolobales archaeon HS-7]|nr:hypothetical protein HS7_19980 [Sulfolobales archaeon HS-7]